MQQNVKRETHTRVNFLHRVAAYEDQTPKLGFLICLTYQLSNELKVSCFDFATKLSAQSLLTICRIWNWNGESARLLPCGVMWSGKEDMRMDAPEMPSVYTDISISSSSSDILNFESSFYGFCVFAKRVSRRALLRMQTLPLGFHFWVSFRCQVHRFVLAMHLQVRWKPNLFVQIFVIFYKTFFFSKILLIVISVFLHVPREFHDYSDNNFPCSTFLEPVVRTELLEN